MIIKKSDLLVFTIPLTIMLIVVIFGIKSFHLWEQVVILWKDDFPISNVLSHPHGPRYLLVYPIFVVSSLLSISYNFLFSLLTAFITASMIYLNVKAIGHFLKRNLNIHEALIIGTIFISITMFMNGRIIFSLLGSSLFLYLISNNPSTAKTLILTFASVALCSVSSGTIMILTFWALVYMLIFKKKSIIEHLIVLFSFMSFFFLFGPYFIRITNKNINYYGSGLEGVLNMLSHGAGKIFFIDKFYLALVTALLISLVVITFIIIALLNKFIVKKELVLLFTLLFIGLSGGLFGFSTLAVSLPLVVILAFVLFEDLVHPTFNQTL
ncbi:hypothetical protein L1D24_18165 [Vibrio brasiliensis]|nr:hypothetical protein [Vibrio brasiliensis]